MKQNKGDEVNSDFKSKFLSDAEIAQQKLDTVSPSMCLAKWKQVSLHLTNGMNNSCYHPPLHAIDAGNLILEIQQNSDTTYRVYDWGRKDQFNKSRKLHVEESLNCIDFNDFNAHLIEPNQNSEQVLADCEHFRIRKFKIEPGSSISLKTENEQCVLLNPLGSSIKIGGTYLASGELGLSPYCEACTISCEKECDVLVTDNFFNATCG